MDPTPNNNPNSASDPGASGPPAAIPSSEPSTEKSAKNAPIINPSNAYTAPRTLPSDNAPTLLTTTSDLPDSFGSHTTRSRNPPRARGSLQPPGPEDDGQEDRGHHEREGETEKGDQGDAEDRHLGAAGGDGEDEPVGEHVHLPHQFVEAAIVELHLEFPVLERGEELPDLLGEFFQVAGVLQGALLGAFEEEIRLVAFEKQASRVGLGYLVDVDGRVDGAG